MFEVRNGSRTLKFEGEHLAHSSSRRADSPRWIEFDLYRTKAGTYVLSRVGVSHVYHSAVCPLVARYGLHEETEDVLTDESEPCEECDPDFDDPIVYPEKFRYWTLTSEDASAVVDALYQKDRNGSRYLTKVADRLLEIASIRDSDIDQAYRVEYLV
ncbi:hypothetical protein QEH42_gp100 [Microbacterium phage Pumpernickel]|uniref:Uncharacterized protein n=1 Tax=Microbacterium phage Pumpernickel TaxID=2885983 RepID=A0AAE8Y8H8_9CAUD|nr:hypothetical protein QEH42_gp100 [Microbacterium phage Pumpernickel]UDL15891.1 hypothetical protein SEA_PUMPERNICKEL_100 [Microbacterium phage Pumpernickel]